MNFSNRIFLLMITATYLWAPGTSLALDRPLSVKEIKILQKNIAKNPDNLKSRLFLANHYYSKKQWNGVIHYLVPVAEQLDSGPLRKLADAYYQTKDLRQAELIVDTLMGKPKISLPTYLLATSILSTSIEETQKAERRDELSSRLFDVLKTAQKQFPTEREIYDQWISMLEKHIAFYGPEALRVMEDMKKNGLKYNAKNHSQLCKFNHFAKFSNETKSSCQQAIIKDPKNPANVIYLGQTLVDTGDEEKGKRMLASVGKKFADSEEALWATAMTFYESKDYMKAYNFFRKASLHKRAQSRDFLGLAKTAFELKKYQVALDAFVTHCRIENYLHHEFRRASGLLKDHPKWQSLFREKMLNCQRN